MRPSQSPQPAVLEESSRTLLLGFTKCYENRFEREEENQHHFRPTKVQLIYEGRTPDENTNDLRQEANNQTGNIYSHVRSKNPCSSELIIILLSKMYLFIGGVVNRKPMKV